MALRLTEGLGRWWVRGFRPTLGWTLGCMRLLGATAWVSMRSAMGCARRCACMPSPSTLSSCADSRSCMPRLEVRYFGSGRALKQVLAAHRRLTPLSSTRSEARLSSRQAVRASHWTPSSPGSGPPQRREHGQPLVQILLIDWFESQSGRTS